MSHRLACVCHNVGIDAFNKQLFHEAHDAFTQSIDFAPRLAMLYVSRANCAIALGDLDLAKDDTMRALQLDTSFSIKDITLRLMSQLFSPDASDELVALAQTDPASIPVKSPKLLQPGPSQS